MIRQWLAHTPVSHAPPATVGSRTGFSTDRIIKEDKVNFNTLKDRKLLYILYRRDPLCWRIVNARAALAIARGFKIIPPHDKARAVVKDFLFSLHHTDPIAALLTGVHSLSIDTGWAGNGWWERLYTKEWEETPYIRENKFVGLRKVHPLTMDFKRRATGEIEMDEEGQFGTVGEFLAYTQIKEDMRRKRDIDKRRISHLVFNTIGDEVLGISDLEPIYKTRHRGMSIEDAIAQGAFRHGVPFLDVEVGDEQHLPDKEMLDEAAEQVRDSSYMSEYVHPPWYKVKMWEQFSLAKSEGMLTPYMQLVSASTGLPLPLLTGSGEGTNKATVKELISMLQPLVIAPMQAKLKLFLETEVLAPLMEHAKIKEIPYIQWNEMFPSDMSLADKIKILSELKIEGKPVINWIEAREMLKFPSSEEGTIYSLSRQELANRRGIYLVEPHGLLIHEGDKKSILSSQEYPSMVGIPLIVISGKLAYGIIKLKIPVKLDDAGFKKFQSSHRVSDEEREKWWGGKTTLYMYPFTVIEMYESPKPVKVPAGIQKFISNVEFLNSEILIENGSGNPS